MVGGAEVPSPAWSALAGAGLTLVEATSAITLHLELLDRLFKVLEIDTENIKINFGGEVLTFRGVNYHYLG